MQQNDFEQVLTNIAYFIQPEYLLEPYKTQVLGQKPDKKKINEYFEKLTTIKFFYDKIFKYEIYFQEFYPNSKKITKAEALEFLIHSYLQDMIILRNKLNHFLDVLKRDVGKIAKNKKEVDEFLETAITKILETFEKVNEPRVLHSHQGKQFLIGDLIKSKGLHLLLQNKDSLLKITTPESLKKIEAEEEVLFEKVKIDYTKLAQRNTEQISGLVNKIFEGIKKLIYLVVRITPLQKIDKN